MNDTAAPAPQYRRLASGSVALVAEDGAVVDILTAAEFLLIDTYEDGE